MIAQDIKKATKTKIDWYAKYTMEHLVLSIDDKGLYCKVASERIEGLAYRVDMDEETMVATRCQCFSKRPCKHMRLATEVFAYKASEGFCEVEAGQWYIIESTTQIWLQDGQWVVVGPAENAVEIVERYLEKQKETPAIEEAPVIEMPAQEVVEVANEARTYYWCPNRCCYKWSDNNRVCEPQPDGKVWNSDICEWITPPSDEPIDHQAELASAGWRFAMSQVKSTAKAAMRVEISEIKARAARTPDMMNAALTKNEGFKLLR